MCFYVGKVKGYFTSEVNGNKNTRQSPFTRPEFMPTPIRAMRGNGSPCKSSTYLTVPPILLCE
ncbi:MAG: hypothetical protein ACE5I1_17760 [bacterium]